MLLATPVCKLQLDSHAARIAYGAESEPSAERRRWIVHGIDHERAGAGNRRDLGSIDDRVAQQGGAKTSSLEVFVHAQHPEKYGGNLGGSVTGKPSPANVGSHDGMRAQRIESRHAPSATASAPPERSPRGRPRRRGSRRKARGP